MGNSLLIQMRRTDESQPYIAPSWAYKFTYPSDLPHRIHGVNATNFWWLEIGGINDTIKDAESISDELTRIGYGVWDYIKNYAPERAQAENWALEWVGSLPGKRESRRYVGDHILTQNDVRDGGAFEDIVAFGGWSMDDHHPAGLLYPGKPTLFHPAPSPYGIPYRSLYSRNVANLLFAGRNISVTHRRAVVHPRHGNLRRHRSGGGNRGGALRPAHLPAPRPEHRRPSAGPAEHTDGRRCLAPRQNAAFVPT